MPHTEQPCPPQAGACARAGARYARLRLGELLMGSEDGLALWLSSLDWAKVRA